MNQFDKQAIETPVPLGIKIVAIFFAFGFILSVVDSITGVTFRISVIFGVSSAVFGIAFLVVAYGLWTLKWWAFPVGQAVLLSNWFSIIILGIFDTLNPDITISGGTDPILWFDTFILTIIIMFYLYTKREFFTR